MSNPFENLRKFNKQIEFMQSFSKKNHKLTSALTSSFSQAIESQQKIRNIIEESGWAKHPKTIDQFMKVYPTASMWASKTMSIKYQLAAYDFANYAREISDYSVHFKKIPYYSDVLQNIYAQLDNEELIQTLGSTAIPNVNEYEDDADGETVMVNPKFFNAAVKLNIMVHTVNVNIQNPDVDEETKSIWKKVIQPLFLALIQLFLAWAVSSTPIEDMNIVQSFRQVIESIQEVEVDTDQDVDLEFDLKDINDKSSESV